MRGIHIRSQSLLRLSIAGIALLFPWATTIAQTVATVTTKDQQVTTTSPVIPAGTTLCTSPKNGGPCKTTAAITLKPLTAMVPGQTSAVAFVPMSVACDFHYGITTLNLDGTLTITGAVCTLTVKK